MKKILIAVLSLSLFTACENEPLEGFFPGTDGVTDPGTGGTGGGGSNNPLQLANYTFDVDTEIPFLGPITINTDFIFNTDNKVSSLDAETIAFGIPLVVTGTITRDSNGKIIGAKNFEGTTQINQTDIFYSSGNTISQIVFDDFEDDSEDYTYNFSTSGNQITRTEVGNTIETIYTTDGSGRLIQKQSFENGVSIQDENLTYDANGNCISVISTGENDNNTTYGFDSFTNPLKDGFSDQYWLTILDDDYDAEAGPAIVQFHSTNNWSSVSSQGSTVTFMITYDADNRITSRDGTFSLDGTQLVQEETFNYLN